MLKYSSHKFVLYTKSYFNKTHFIRTRRSKSRFLSESEKSDNLKNIEFVFENFLNFISLYCC